MSTLKNFTQTAIEKKKRTVDYSNWLDTGEVLTDHSILISPLTDPPLVASDGFSSNGDTEITFYLSGGIVGTYYDVKLVAVTSDSQIKEDNVQLAVAAQ